MFKRVSISIILILTITVVGFSQTTDLLISEYVEGSSSNKYLEIYNGTGASVNLANYELRLYSNGAGAPTTTNVLSGTLPDNSVIVYRNSSATIYGGATTIASAVNFNGDDAIALYNTGTASFADIFGNIGCDPGSSWSSGGNSTVNKTLVRNANICSGVTVDDATSCPFPTLAADWTQFNQDDISNLGSHTNTCSIPCVADAEPTTNSSALNFSNIDCTSMDLSWTSGNGANRIVVASTSVIAGTPSDQTAYAANAVFGSGATIAAGEFVVYNGSGSSFTVTGLANSTTYYFAIFEYNGVTANCEENYFLTALTGNATTTFATEPAVNASAYTFSNIGCNGIKISWTSPVANDSSLVVMKAGSDVTTDPVDGTAYTANTTFGSGTDIGTSEFVVYDGAGTSVTITGLTASTTYYFNVFEYNGGTACLNYRTSDEVSSFTPTVSCDTCAYLTSALINSCDNAPCTEGDNEMLFFNSGNYYVSTAASDITINYGSSSPAPNTYGDSFTTNSNAIDSMNADLGCAGVYIDASTVSTIPPNSSFLILNETVCADAFDWSSMCSATTGNIYVLFSDDATWTSAGQFSNSPPAAGRYFRTIFEGCAQNYKYDNALPSGDGAIVFWDESAGNAAAYDTNGCSLPATVLPITLIHFKGTVIENGKNLLEWSTSSEINNDYFTIERSANASDFNAIRTINGAGNSNVQLNYNFVDDSPNAGINYYRLKQTDFNGDYAYSEIIAINNNLSDINIYTANSFLFIESNKTGMNGSIQIFDALGRVIFSDKIASNTKISTANFSTGIYIVKIGTSDNFIVQKIKF